ncbi:MAG TPA: pyridoxamine 5'-phosphate oxidase family protein [Thermoleophilaceae bacterium]|nr:pyridoxamine 5'-phosphate oxidase family protein [Thermoleophilaceae bacterium]
MATVPTDRTRVRRVPQRGAYERETIDAILDETLISHVGFVHDGHPVVIPTLHARLGDRLYLHGSAASRMLRTLHRGVPVCVTATLVDGLVLARSAFHHSVNYRSVVVFGTATLIEPGDETAKALELFTEKLVPGRWADVRPPTRQELKGTKVLSLPLDEASAKVRTGPPIDEDEDYDLPVWAGVLPLATDVAEPQPDPRLDPAIETPGYVAAWRP